MADRIRLTGVSGTIDNFVFDFIGTDLNENTIPLRQRKKLQSVLVRGKYFVC